MRDELLAGLVPLRRNRRKGRAGRGPRRSGTAPTATRQYCRSWTCSAPGTSTSSPRPGRSSRCSAPARPARGPTTTTPNARPAGEPSTTASSPTTRPTQRSSPGCSNGTYGLMIYQEAPLTRPTRVQLRQGDLKLTRSSQRDDIADVSEDVDSFAFLIQVCQQLAVRVAELADRS